MTDVSQMARAYRLAGFLPFPLSPLQKVPVEGTPLNQAFRIPFVDDSNIGVFAGSRNNLAVIDADSDVSLRFVTEKLKDMGLWDWTTIVLTPRRKGYHFWLRLYDKPQGAQAYYKLSQAVGSGEFRVGRPAYVVAPCSVIAEGQYEFVQGGIEFFNDQPAVKWRDLLWLAPQGMAQAGRAKGGSVSRRKVSDPPKAVYNPRPKILALVDLIHSADARGRVRRIDYRTGRPNEKYFDTRSEAEAALVTGLIMSGWSFDQVQELFEREQFQHYGSVPRMDYYLTTTWNKSCRYVEGRQSGK